MPVYFDRKAREENDRLNYTDLIVWKPGYVEPARGELVVPVQAIAPGLWYVHSPLVVDEVEEGGDSLDIHVHPSNLPAPGEVTDAELRRLDFAFDPVAWPRALPARVAHHLGIGPSVFDAHWAFIRDVCFTLRERARDAVVERNQHAPGTRDHDFQNGRVLAFVEVLSHMQNQASSSGLDEASIGLDLMDSYAERF